MRQTCADCRFATRVSHSTRYEHICWYASGMAVTRLLTEGDEYPPACVEKMIETDDEDVSEPEE